MVTRKNRCAEAFSAILESATTQILVNRQAVLETDDPEGAHQLRIGLRRLRGALRALRPLVDRDCLRAFERSARNLGRSAGMLRDADVMISGIMAPMEAVASDKSGFAELHAALVRDRQGQARGGPRRVTQSSVDQVATLLDALAAHTGGERGAGKAHNQARAQGATQSLEEIRRAWAKPEAA